MSASECVFCLNYYIDMTVGFSMATMEEEIPEEEKTRLEKLAEKPRLLFVTFVAFCIYGIVGITFDWLWVNVKKVFLEHFLTLNMLIYF